MLGRYTYTLSTLTPDEEIVLVGRLHYFALIIPLCLTGLTVALLLYGVAFSFQRTGNDIIDMMRIIIYWSFHSLPNIKLNG